MILFNVIAVLIALTALCSYVNHRYLRIHPTVGVLLVSMIASLAVIALGKFGWADGLNHAAQDFVSRIQFGQALLQWMLGFLLFAGAMKVDAREIANHRGIIAALAFFSTIASMLVVAVLIHLILSALSLPADWLTCLLFGALISPTDPVAVLNIILRSSAPKSTTTIIAAEALVNDAVGVVLFLALLNLSNNHAAPTFTAITRLFLQQSAGGAALGIVAGLVVRRMLKNTRDLQVSVLLSIALVMIIYVLANFFHCSGPMGAIVAGLLVENPRRASAAAQASHARLDLAGFWELINELLNVILFVMIGLEVLAIPFPIRYLLAGLAAIPAVLLARAATVIPIVRVSRTSAAKAKDLEVLLIWGGLRGGLALAMALSLPSAAGNNPIIVMTYVVVSFAILVQGSTLKRIAFKPFQFSS